MSLISVLFLDPTRCIDTPCFPGVPCSDLSRGEVVSNTDLDNPPEIILQYTCGNCPPGYRGDGVQCNGKIRLHPRIIPPSYIPLLPPLISFYSRIFRSFLLDGPKGPQWYFHDWEVADSE